MNVTCETFRDAAEDLALGFARSPERDDLVAHAAGCADCASTLRELTAVTDALLELAPEAEPPVGFEARAVAAMRPGSSRTVRRRLVLAATAAVVVLLAAIVLARPGGDDDRATRAAEIQGRRGPLGRVELVAAPSPKVVVLLEDDGWDGVWVCELQDDDGAWVEVGRWTADEATGGAWAVNVDRSLLDAGRMRITSAGGAVIATSDDLH